MKHIFTYFLIISVGVNVYFIVYLMGIKSANDEKMKLVFSKNISYKEGYEFLEKKMKLNFSEANFKQKPYFVYFWNTEMYDINGAAAMRGLDSLASELGEYSFNYVFATEIDEASAKDFLTARGAKFENFMVLGGMDDFISGVYSEKPIKWKQKKIGPRNLWGPDLNKLKVDGYYVLINKNGEILYNNHKFATPLKDTSLIRRLRSFPTAKKLQN